MASEAAKLLDELMGRNRNLDPDDKLRAKPKFENPEVTKQIPMTSKILLLTCLCCFRPISFSRS